MRLFISIILFFIILVSCSSEEVTKNYEVGGDFLDDNINIRVIDTFSINIGTFKTETIETSGTNLVLLGSIRDNALGDLKAQPYFKLETDEDNFALIENDTKYDSIGFIMNFNGYYEGDTIRPQTYRLHQILEEVEPDDDNDEDTFFNSSELLFDTNSIGEITIIPKPNKATDSLYIPISDTIGLDIFEKIQNEDIESNNDFLNTFEGLTIIPEINDSHVLGFNVLNTQNASNNTFMRLYYTLEDNDDEGDDETYMDFIISDPLTLFNAITTEESTIAPELTEILDDSEITVFSEDTDNLTYVQAGTGISTRIEIPSIKKLNGLSDFGSVLSAELTFTPSKDSFKNKSDLQQSLLVSIINKNNITILSQLVDISGNAAFAELDTEDDSEFNLNTSYTVDLSGYVNLILSSETDLDYSLMVQFTDSNTTVERTVIDASEELKLSIKYLTYN